MKALGAFWLRFLTIAAFVMTAGLFSSAFSPRELRLWT